MKEVKGLLLASLYGMFCGGIATANQNEGGEQDVEALLGAETFSERELAADQLWEKGLESVNLLNAMALSDNPEQAWRARQILRWVDLEMTPDTPKEIVDLVERYLTASNMQDREAVYTALLKKEAYVQLFRLPRHVSDEVVARSLAERVAELAGAVAEEKILGGFDEEALAILEDAKNAKAGHLRWVALASALGKKDELWDDLSQSDRMRFARWEGDIDLIRQLAEPDHEIQRSLQLLDGEVLPYLERRSKRSDSEGMRARIAKSLLPGSEDGEAESLLKGLLTALKENGLESSQDVVVLLAQMGFAEEVLPYFEESFPTQMFGYYEGSERLADAFRCVGLKLGEPIPEEWIEGTVAKVGKEFDQEKNEGCILLLSVGLFLVERGEVEEGEKLLDALYEKMNEEGLNEVIAMLNYLGGRQRMILQEGYPEYAIRKASEREEETFEPEAFLSEVFFSDESLALFYRFLEERDAEMSDWQRVRAVFAVFGHHVDFPKEELDTILAELEDNAKNTASEAEWMLLMQTAMYRGDIGLFERSLRVMSEIAPDRERMEATLASLLLFDGRFEEAVAIYEGLLEEDPSRVDRMVVLAAALEAAGRSEEAKGWLLKLEKLALGDGSWLITMGDIWGQLGDWKQQHGYYQRAFLLFPSETSRWDALLKALATSGRKAGYWKQAAACGEASNTSLSFDLASNPSVYFKTRGEVEFARAMAAYEDGEEEVGDQILNRVASYCGYDSFFADDIFPVLRLAGLHEQAEKIWDSVSPTYHQSMNTYPDGHNAFNTTAWIASRAACDLDEAMVWVDHALKGRPGSSAYLDTKGEVYFALENREEALKWSEKACEGSEGIGTLAIMRVQYRHFRDDPFPLPSKEEPLKDKELPKAEVGPKDEEAPEDKVVPEAEELSAEEE